LATRVPPVVHGAVLLRHVLRASDGRLMLIDFGQGREPVQDGTLHDHPDDAPEQWVGDATPASDVFGVGTVAASLLVRRPVAVHETHVLDGLPIGEELRTLIGRMRSLEPTHRPSWSEVVRPRPASEPRTSSSLLRTAAFVIGVLVLWQWMLLQFSGERFSSSELPQIAIAGPLEPHVPGVDLADVAPPGADCGGAFTAVVELRASSPRPLVAVACDGGARLVGEHRPGDFTRIRFEGRGGIVDGWEPRFVHPVTADAREAIVQRGNAHTLTLTLEGGPLDGGTIWPARRAHFRRDEETGRPDLRRGVVDRGPWMPRGVGQTVKEGVVQGQLGGVHALRIDGVFRWVAPGPELGTYTVQPATHQRTVLVRDEDGEPVVDAEVVCLPPEGGRGVVHARTSWSGRAVCGSPDVPHAWAFVDAPGRVAVTTPLVPGDVGVVLREARTLFVGCKGAAEDRCGDVLGEPPVCEGAGMHSGICRDIGDVTRCDCAPEARFVSHGVLGAVALTEADHAWFDLRELGVPVSGSMLDGSSQTAAKLMTKEGSLVAHVDEQLQFRFPGVPAGRYTMG
ncbi:MAG: hypothetical protein AAF211_31830, partial [Myxococcota bacterium]